MAWKIVSTKAFGNELRRLSKNKALLDAFEKLLERLKSNPEAIGGHLAGPLKGKKSTRILGKYRLIFQIADSKEKAVYLLAIDHRKFAYR